MSDIRTNASMILSWSMLVAGAGLTGLGLMRTLARSHKWRLATHEDQDQIVIGDSRLSVGQTVTVAQDSRSRHELLGETLSGEIVEITRSHCVISVDRLRSRGGGVADRLAGNDTGDTSTGRDNGRDGWIEPGSAVTVCVTAAGELYRFSTRIKDSHRTSRDLRMYFPRPATLARIQRRRHLRIGLDLPATFERIWSADEWSSPASERPGSQNRILHGTVRDLSAGGLRADIGGVQRLIDLDHVVSQYTPESTVRIGLPFPALPRNAIFARVRSCARGVTRGGLTAQMACEFLPMPVWEQDIVVQHVFRLHREALRAAKMRRNGGQPGLCQ